MTKSAAERADGVFASASIISDNDCDGQVDALDADCISSSLDCNSATPNVSTLWPPNNKMVPVAIGGVTTHNGAPATITIDGIFQDEWDGKMPDASGIGQARASVRAERMGGEDGRVYVIEFTATDSAGGSCRGAVTVCVPHDQDRLVCVDSGARYRSTK